ncbi:MAG: tRNA lysidine(34) synthetase TilS [Hyphomicrobiaceae bacterium]|nr:tRNA lysidine(34) synthetase TilS [Hyphomicrobiaceae bacterium]
MTTSRDRASAITPEERDRLLAPLANQPLALCVSGGPDSMTLMHLVAEWASAKLHNAVPDTAAPFRPLEPPTGPTAVTNRPNANAVSPGQLAAEGGVRPIVVLTIDHGLRPEAAAEARFVADAADKLGLPCLILTVDEPLPVTGIQEWARGLRHRLMLEVLDGERQRSREMGWRHHPVERCLVMAHHRDDQAETVLMRLARGSGLEGLAGMRPRQSITTPATAARPHSITAEVCRPFLDIPKSRLLATVSDRAIACIDDPTNTDARFERVRVRTAMTVLAELGVSAEAIARSARRLREAHQALDRFEVSWLAANIDWHQGLMAQVPAEALAASSGPASLARVLERLLAAQGGSARRAERAQIEALAEDVIHRRAVGWTLGGCRIEWGVEPGGALSVWREAGASALPVMTIEPGQDISWDGGRFTVSADRSASGTAIIRALGPQAWSRLKRTVDGLDELRLRADAMAVLPAIWEGEDLIGLPWLDSRLLAPGCTLKAGKAWRAYRNGAGDMYGARFTGNRAVQTDEPA